MAERPIFLLGFMCSGKTTLGKEMSRQLSADFIDLDEFIESSAGRTISEIFASEGEAGFRSIEADALTQVIRSYSGKTAIIALGGGTPCRPGVMERLNAAGTTIHLDAPVERLVERLVIGAANRPLVRDKSADELSDYVASMLERRNPFYGLAQLRFDSSELETKAQIELSARRLIESLFSLT